MARIFSSGFELQSVGTSFKEWDRAYSPAGLFGSISTSIKRSGAASFRISGDIANGSGIGIAQDSHTLANNNRKTWFRAYVLFESFPTGQSGGVMSIADDGNFANAVVMINASGQAQYYWNSNPTFLAVSPASSALNLHQWYRFEIFLNTTTPTSWSGEFRIDGVTISTFSGNNGGDFVCAGCQLFSEPFSGTATGVDQYYDDVALNDDTGSFQNSWPGEGKIVHLKPNAAGDNNAWKTTGGVAGDANNFQKADETIPNDVTDFLMRNTASTPIDDYNCETSSSAGIGATDTISVVQVGARVTSNGSSKTSRDVKLRIKGQSGGTVQTGTVVFWYGTIWVTHFFDAPATYSLTSYTNPQNGAAWTPATLDSMQIGMQPNTSSANLVECSTLWALVDYVPASAVQHQGTTKWPATAPIIANLLLNALAFANIGPTLSVLANASEFDVALASLPGDLEVIAGSDTYRPISAVLPCSASLVTNPLPKFTLAISLPLSSSLVAATKQWWAATAILPADSSVTANTKQNYGVFATLPCDSVVYGDTRTLYKGTPELFALTATLNAKGFQRWTSAASFALSSDLSFNVLRQYYAGTTVLAASASLQANTIQGVAAFAVLGLTAAFYTPGAGTLPISARIDLSGSLTANTLWVQRAFATLAATATLIADSQLFRLILATLPAAGSVLANMARFTNATAVLADSSSLAAGSTQAFAGYAELDCSSVLAVNTTQTIKHVGTAQLDLSSSLVGNLKRITFYEHGNIQLSSDLKVNFTPLFSMMSATLSGASTLTANGNVPDRSLTSVWLCQSTLAANAVQRWAAQSSYALTSDCSAFSLQRWGSKASLNLTSAVQASLVQKMFERSSWPLASKFFAGSFQFGKAKAGLIMVFSLRANTVIHLIKNHNKTKKHLRGDVEKVNLHAGTAEIEEVP